MIEIDMWAKFELDHESQEQVNMRNDLNSNYTEKMEAFRSNNDQPGMLAYCRYVTHEMYKLSPHSLPPNLPKGKQYDAFIDALGDFRMKKYLSQEIKKSDAVYLDLFNNLRFYEKDEKQYVDVNDFINALDKFLEAISMEMDLIYNCEKGDLVNDYLPRSLYQKSKLQEGIRNWLPYIEDGHADIVLSKYNITQEFIEVNPPQMQTVFCSDCHLETLLPKDSVKYVCQGCRHENIVRATVNCGGCGSQNPIPEKWTLKISCIGCGAELRVVQPIEE
jgi:hypothetical protein